MLNLLLALILGAIIGWSLHSFFLELHEPNILNTKMNHALLDIKPPKKLTIKELKIKKPISLSNSKIEEKTQTITAPKESFYTLLEKNLFADAMALYLESSNKNLPLYRSTLLDYFKIKSIKEPSIAIAQMLEFRELEPKNYTISLLLIDTYNNNKTYKKAINLILELMESNVENDVSKLNKKLISSSQLYIKKLQDANDAPVLILFLEEQISLGIQTPFYTYALANYYVELQKYLLATELLKEIEFDENYGAKANHLSTIIEQKIEEQKEYAYGVRLHKEGEHFTIDVLVEDTPLTLLLDTGATLTMINEEKIAFLNILNENLTINTAGGEINAQLKEANSFKIGEIELKKFQIVSATFQQENADGLLGMNFFKEFKFKIDQKHKMLYLSKK